MANYKMKCTILKLLIFLFEVTSLEGTINNCGESFQKKCTCGIIEYDRVPQYVVNCTNARFMDTSVLEHMPADVAVLIFTGNVLINLPWNIFGKINEYPNLKIIDMSNNHIREIRGKTYHHVQRVERLILNHNNLSISSNDDDINHLHPRIFSNFLKLRELHLTNAFSDYSSPELSQNLHAIFVNSNLTQLMKLHLEQNEISHFKDPNVFCDLPHLEDLHLGDNNLKDLNFNITCLHRLRYLDLERNSFEALNQKDMNTMDELNILPGRSETLIVDFNMNPFVCECSVYSFVKWLKTTSIILRRSEALTCHRSTDSTEMILLSVNFNKCLHQHQDRQDVILVFFSMVFSFISLGVVGALLYVNQDRVKHFMHPVMSARKVHYTSIRDDEYAQEVHV